MHFRPFFVFFVVTANFLSVKIASAETSLAKTPGWLWYNESQEPPKKELKKGLPKEQPKNESASMPPVGTARHKLELLKIELEEALAEAVVTPNPKTIRRFHFLQAQAIRDAERFEKIYMAIANQDEPLGRTIQNPKAMELFEEESRMEQQKIIARLPKKFGIVFAFHADCHHCLAFAPVVKAFGEQYGFHVMGISPDGRGLPEFPTPKKDNGILAGLNPEKTFPAVFLVNARSGMVIPIARSLLNKTQLEENVASIIQNLYEEGRL